MINLLSSVELESAGLRQVHELSGGGAAIDRQVDASDEAAFVAEYAL
ncbi:MAG: hypothetical protein WBE37_06435 [Bryobacteraceae bacterium]